jgi:hypothetical protein
MRRGGGVKYAQNLNRNKYRKDIARKRVNKLILRRNGVELFTGFIRLMIGTSGGL